MKWLHLSKNWGKCCHFPWNSVKEVQKSPKQFTIHVQEIFKKETETERRADIWSEGQLCFVVFLRLFFFPSLRRMQQTSNSQFKLNLFHLTAWLSIMSGKKRQQKETNTTTCQPIVYVCLLELWQIYQFLTDWKFKRVTRYHKLSIISDPGHCGSLSYMVVSWQWDISVTDLLYIAALLVIKAVTSFMQLITLTAASLHFHILPKADFMSRSCWVIYNSGSGRVTNMMSWDFFYVRLNK